jgi:hypothetical protein
MGKCRTSESGFAEDVVCADPPPDDVRFALGHSFSVLKRCPTVVGPGHFEDPSSAFDSLDSESLAELALPEVLDELCSGKQERGLLGRSESAKL